MTETTFRGSGTEADAVAEIYAIPTAQGGVKIADTDAWAATPRRSDANRLVLDAKSFIGYLARHGDERTEIYADPRAARIVGIVDSHHVEPGWQSHRVNLSLVKSPSWVAWEKFDGAWMKQVDFAEHIELQSPDVIQPTPAELLELAQHFEAKQSVDFESSDRIDNGQVRLQYKETVKAKAGQTGQIDIPTNITLAIKPYIGSPTYRIEARFRYRIQGTQLVLGYVLKRPHIVLESAFDDIVETIRDGWPGNEAIPAYPGLGDKHPIYTGTPAN